jgi:hypothetical protein
LDFSQAPQPYSFEYDVQDKESYNDFLHSEKSDYNVVTGSYRVALPDGRTQIVTYRADKDGYNADVKYEGEAKYPEYVEKQYKAASYPAPAYSAPAYKAPEYKAPAYVAPVYSAPVYKAPAYSAPAYTAPAYKPKTSYVAAPSYKAPAAYPKY